MEQNKPEYHVVSLSGGKDSTAMLLMMLERGMQIDCILFCDTGLEFPGLYAHLDKLEQYIGRPITRIILEAVFMFFVQKSHKFLVVNKDVVEFTPEYAAEAAELEALWVKMGNCVGGNKALSPIGVYVPSENKTAVFYIDGLSEQEAKEVPVIRAPYDTDVYCVTCNKTQHIKAGEPIPFCCDRMMEILD